MNERTHLDLFSGGCAGFTLGLECAGFRTIAFSEIDPDACIQLKGLYPHIPNVGDIRTLRGSDFLRAHGWPMVVTGGVPCQPASALGAMRGTADERWLWPDTIRVVGELRPWQFIAENPPAILVLEDGRAWNGIVSGLVALGYDCQWDVFPAAALGAGHLRERLFLIATNSDCLRRRQRTGLREGASGRIGRGRSCNDNLPTPLLAAHSDRARLEGHAGNGYRDRGPDERRSVAAPCLPDLRQIRIDAPDWWQTQSPVQPVVDGLPGKLVEAALRIVGNSVLPHIPYLIGTAIRQIEEQ